MGFLKRKLDVIPFFWTLVLGFGAGGKRDVSGLRRTCERTTGTTWASSALYHRLDAKLVKLRKASLERALASLQFAWVSPMISPASSRT